MLEKILLDTYAEMTEKFALNLYLKFASQHTE